MQSYTESRHTSLNSGVQSWLLAIWEMYIIGRAFRAMGKIIDKRVLTTTSLIPMYHPHGSTTDPCNLTQPLIWTVTDETYLLGITFFSREACRNIRVVVEVSNRVYTSAVLGDTIGLRYRWSSSCEMVSAAMLP